jgi:hypothetical protein
VTTADILTHLRSTLLPRPDEASRTAVRLPGPRRAPEQAAVAPVTGEASGPPPGWVARTSRPPRPAHEPGS